MSVSVKKAEEQDYNRINSLLSVVSIPVEREAITYFFLENKKIDIIGVIGIRLVEENGKQVGQLRPLVLTKECTEENLIQLLETLILYAESIRIDELKVTIHNLSAKMLFCLLDFYEVPSEDSVTIKKSLIMVRKCRNKKNSR